MTKSYEQPNNYLRAAREHLARFPAQGVNDLKRMNSVLARSRHFWGQLKTSGLRKPVVAVIGGTVLLIGVALIVLPGPAFVVIPLGLAILATEFLWAKRWLKKARSMLPGRAKSHRPQPTAAKEQ